MIRTRTWRTLLAFACLTGTTLSTAARPLAAAPLGWIIDPSQSKVTLSIPDQSVVIEGINATLRVRNQSSANNGNNVWNVGNSARLSGMLWTDYSFNSLEILPSSSATLALNSGAYRPNPAAYSAPLQMDGTASGGTFTNTSTAQAEFGARLRATVLSQTQDANYFSLDDTWWSFDSPVLPLTNQLGMQTFAANTTSAQMGGKMALDTVGVTSTPDEIFNFSGLGGTNTASTGTIDPNGLVLQLTLPLNFPISFYFEDAIVQGNVTGTLVAHHIPEPTTMMLAAAGLMALPLAWQRKRRAA